MNVVPHAHHVYVTQQDHQGSVGTGTIQFWRHHLLRHTHCLRTELIAIDLPGNGKLNNLIPIIAFQYLHDVHSTAPSNGLDDRSLAHPPRTCYQDRRTPSRACGAVRVWEMWGMLGCEECVPLLSEGRYKMGEQLVGELLQPRRPYIWEEIWSVDEWGRY